jgi:hypothetical protein
MNMFTASDKAMSDTENIRGLNLAVADSDCLSN